MITEITKAQLLAHAGRAAEGSGQAGAGAYFDAEAEQRGRWRSTCARLSRDLLGANGIMDEYPIMRHMCNLETVKTYEGTDHIHTLVIGEQVTGIAAYK